MKKAEVVEKTIAYGKNRYRVSASGKWSVLMWGWFMDGNEKPECRWGAIPEDRVPEAVKQKA